MLFFLLGDVSTLLFAAAEAFSRRETAPGPVWSKTHVTTNWKFLHRISKMNETKSEH